MHQSVKLAIMTLVLNKVISLSFQVKLDIYLVPLPQLPLTLYLFCLCLYVQHIFNFDPIRIAHSNLVLLPIKHS